MKDRTTVSIITPTFNNERFIADNIRSILSQTYPNIEHIIIDGWSTDNTLPMVREMEPTAVALSEPDEGISDAFNKGIRLANVEKRGQATFRVGMDAGNAGSC